VRSHARRLPVGTAQLSTAIETGRRVPFTLLWPAIGQSALYSPGRAPPPILWASAASGKRGCAHHVRQAQDHAQGRARVSERLLVRGLHGCMQRRAGIVAMKHDYADGGAATSNLLRPAPSRPRPAPSVQSVSCPLPARWWHATSSPLPSAQAYHVPS